jgi:hypothetical protein
MLDTFPPDYARRLMEFRRAMLTLDDSQAARSVYYAMDVWPPSYAKLRVCFFGGSAEMRSRIAREASDWMMPDNGIKFDFGDPQDPRICGPRDGRENQIRISFDRPGQWSAAGVQSVLALNQDEPSMNYFDLDKFDPVNLHPYYVGAIRHEFGHALGLMHEHQSPASPCENEYDWPKVYEMLGGPPEHWSKDYVDFAMRPIMSEPGREVAYGEFDRHSIMIYDFPPEYFLRGTASPCYTGGQILAISPHDRAVAAKLYPAAASARKERFDLVREAFQAVWNKAQEEGRKGAAMDLPKLYFDLPGNAGE